MILQIMDMLCIIGLLLIFRYKVMVYGLDIKLFDQDNEVTGKGPL